MLHGETMKKTCCLLFMLISLAIANTGWAGGSLETGEVLPILNQNPRWAKSIQDQFTLSETSGADVRLGRQWVNLGGKRAGPYQIPARRKNESGEFNLVINVYTDLTFVDANGAKTTMAAFLADPKVQEKTFANAVDTKERLTRVEVTGKDEQAPKFIADLKMPAGWACVYSNVPGFMVAHPRFTERYDFLKPTHGLAAPLFALEFENTASPFNYEGKQYNPWLRLTFYAQADKAKIQAIEEKEKLYSWDTPMGFGETKTHYIISTAEWMNYSFHAPQTRTVYQPFEEKIKKIFTPKTR